MVVGDLVYNDDFDCIGKPLDNILDMKIKYITTQGSTIVIEATK